MIEAEKQESGSPLSLSVMRAIVLAPGASLSAVCMCVQ
jgi:hypothetical protein